MALGLAGAALLSACGGAGAATTNASSAAAPATSAAATSSAAPTTSAAVTTASQPSTSAASASAVASTSSAAPSSSAATSSSAPAGKGITLTYMSPDDTGRHDAETPIFADFAKANPGINVEIVSGGASWTTVQTKLKTSIAGNVPINVFQNGWGSWGDFEAALMELTSLFARDKMDPYKLLTRPAVDTFLDQGKLWGFGLVGVSQDGLAYNQDLFDAAGLPHPPVDPADQSWTMERFLESAQKLTKADQLQFGFGGSLAGFDTGGMTRGTFFGQGPWDDTAQQAHMDKPGMLQGLQYWKDIRDRYKVQPTSDQAKSIGAKGDIFTSGKIGMQVVYGYIPKQTFNWGLVALPHDGSDNISGRGYSMPLMATKTAASEQTWTLLKWTLASANAARFPETAHYAISPVLGASDQAKQAFKDKVGVDPTAYELMAQHSHVSAWGMLKYKGFSKVSDWLTNAFKPFDTGTQSTSDYAKGANDYINANLMQ